MANGEALYLNNVFDGTWPHGVAVILGTWLIIYIQIRMCAVGLGVMKYKHSMLPLFTAVSKARDCEK